MTLKDFEKHMDKVILSKGKDCFASGAVDAPYESGDGEWSAEVQGADLHSVVIKLDDINILSTSCDCSHDNYCEHKIAVLYSLRELLLNNKEKKLLTKANSKSRK